MDDIFSLIRKMSKTEKRLFAISFNKKKADDSADTPAKSPKKYLQLFQAYQKLAEKHEKVPVTEDKSLREKLCKDDANQFLVLKNYLADLLLDFLRHHHRENLPELRLNNLLLDARILEEKGEVEWCIRKLKKALDEAMHYQLFHLVVEANTRLVRIMMRHIVPTFETLESYFLKIEDCLSKQQTELKYRRESCRIMLKQKQEFKLARTAEQFAEVEVLEKNLLERNVQDPPLTFTAQHSYFHSQVSIASMKGGRQQSYEAAKALVEVWDNYPQMIRLDKVTYFVHQGNLLVYTLLANKMEEAAALITKLEAINCKNQEEEVAKIANLDTRTFSFLMNRNSLDEALRFGGELERKMKKYAHLLPSLLLNNFEFNFSVIHFLMGDFKNARVRLSSLLERDRYTMPKFKLITFEMLEMVLWYELKEFVFIQNSYHAKAKRMGTSNIENKFERKVLNTLFKLTNTLSESSRRTLLRGLRQYLAEVRRSENFIYQTGFGEIEIWSEARSEGISIREAFRRTLK